MGPQRMYGLTPWVRRLLVANLLVFLIQSTLLTSPSFVGAFGFSPAHAWQYPWTFITYMFLHAGIPHILFNMLVLFVFGSSVEERMGGRAFILFYLLCGIGGAVGIFILIISIGSAPKPAAYFAREGCGGRWILTGDDLRPDSEVRFDWERDSKLRDY